MTLLVFNVIKIFSLGAISFITAFLLTPVLTHYLYKYKFWRKAVRTKSIDGKEVPIFQKFHTAGETSVPRGGGILIWGATLAIAFIFLILSKITNVWWFQKLNFLSRSQTWLPLFALFSAALVGLIDDFLVVVDSPPHHNKDNTTEMGKLMKSFLVWCGGKGKYAGGGLRLKSRLLLVALIGLIGGWWFYSKLGFTTIHIPGNGDIFLGWWYIPLFILVMMATYSGGVIDGLDGLAGGAFAAIFGAFSIISLFSNQIDLGAFCAVVSGATLAFLWFNIPPARFYMGETGIIGLCCALTVVAFLTDSVLVLPIIAFLLVIESASVISQLLSRKIRGRKLFLAAPIHHHFEAKGWPSYKITMRFWVVGVVMAIIGVAVRLFG